MITLEEIVQRLDTGKIEYGIPNEAEAENWKPTILNDYIVPQFYINESSAPGAKKKRETSLGKILSFIERVRHIRSKNGCTIMPIPTTSKTNLDIWGSPKNISRAIDLMTQIGLISIENDYHRFGALYDVENCSRLFRYYKENEDKLIEYCKNENITQAVSLNYVKKKKIKHIKSVSIKDVLFSSSLRLAKPKDCSISEFEDYLIECLYINYPELKLHQQIADDINRMYYQNYPEFRIRFKPNITWDNQHRYVKGIGIRATNSLCTLKKDLRSDLKKQYNFTVEKDVKSSVPRITLSLNSGKWVDESVDIYELIFNELNPGEQFTNEKREAIKALHMRAYFDSSDLELGKHVWLRMNKENVVKDEVYEILQKFKQALVKIEGGKLYGNEIFLVESCIYMDTLYDLLSCGHKVWEVYDGFYSNEITNDISFEELVMSGVKTNFTYYYSQYFKNKK